ncbi:carbon storage regulator CsrA [Clostridium fallax]|uniref:Translational regulator CsrA n=1 Tax=Clostridium fallax TaxID=1533 RepID=A0A1M4ULY2_9CLOT|nr:carbon storage regulator CsrA [Clostridium fallax]SHE57694.1 carbon storage regulator, CsrA [Clostridium fallax]SQB07636.1 carbon storage regulator [Clostridium fallax]
MLVIKRKEGEGLVIGDDIEINIVKVDDKTVKLAISAPKDVSILRKELVLAVEEENKEAMKVDLSILNKLK